jgi:hypothetical protein
MSVGKETEPSGESRHRVLRRAGAKAFGQWKKTSSTSTRRASAGRCERTTMSSKKGPSVTIRAAVDPHGLLSPRDQQDQADVGVREDVVEAVHAPVARSLGDGQRGLVQDVHEARRVTLGRDVARSVAAGRRDEDERAGRESGFSSRPAGSPMVSTSSKQRGLVHTTRLSVRS